MKILFKRLCVISFYFQIVFGSNYVSAQTDSLGRKDKIIAFDRFGNSYKASEISFNSTGSGVGKLLIKPCTAGFFQIDCY